MHSMSLDMIYKKLLILSVNYLSPAGFVCVEYINQSLADVGKIVE